VSNKPVNLIVILEERLLRAELGLRAVTEEVRLLSRDVSELERRLDKLDPPVRKRA
jgi:ubiquinone biosynthesis protein UbiJ